MGTARVRNSARDHIGRQAHAERVIVASSLHIETFSAFQVSRGPTLIAWLGTF